MKKRHLPTLPPMRCDDGCGDCCGAVPATAAERARVETYARTHGIEPRRQGITCPWYDGKRCAVYTVRPLVCVAMGHVPRLECSRGYNRNVPARAVDKAFVANGRPTTLLHHVLIDRGLAPSMEALVGRDVAAFLEKIVRAE